MAYKLLFLNLISKGLGEAGFSMVRLKEIAKQRELFSSVESLSNESSESDVRLETISLGKK